jgi:polyprenyl P-hydroxybenzoate/phenylacrylic acid decarboxylase-like protein
MRIVVAITGATGACYGVRLLQSLAELGVERHLVLSRWAEVTLRSETGLTAGDLAGMASVVYGRNNQGAAIASGSFQHDGMVIAPCSMKTLAAVRHGYGDGLVARAADVTLKERRRLVVLARETPLTEGHLENMLGLTRMGAIVCPPVPAFYNDPRTIDDLVDHTVGRVLDLFGLSMPNLQRWTGLSARNDECAPPADLPPFTAVNGSQT